MYFSEGLPAFRCWISRLPTFASLGLENDGKARQLARYVKEIGERYVDQSGSSDDLRTTAFFVEVIIFPTCKEVLLPCGSHEMNENYEHQHQTMRNENGIEYGDLPEFMDFEYLRKNTCLNLVPCQSGEGSRSAGRSEAG